MNTHAILAILCVVASAAAAQQPAPPPAAQQKAAAPVTKQDAKAPATRPADTKTQGTSTKVQGTKTADTKQGTKAGDTRAPARPGLAVAPEAAAPPRVPVILREVYTYDAEGRRDPFVTLLTSDELRPNIADLRLVTILLDPVRPIAVMREAGTNTQYRVTLGMKLGRMKVAMIKRRSVIFSIEEFGLNRLDSLVLGDTTKARAK